MAGGSEDTKISLILKFHHDTFYFHRHLPLILFVQFIQSLSKEAISDISKPKCQYDRMKMTEQAAKSPKKTPTIYK